MVGNILSHPQTLTRVRLLVPCQHQLKKKYGLGQLHMDVWGVVLDDAKILL